MISKNDLQAFNEEYRILIKANDFMYMLPHPSLRSWISNYTITFPSRDTISNNYSVIPHGCATLVFACNESNIASNLFGPASKPVKVGNEANKAYLLFIVEFQPAGLYAFNGMPQKELTDCVIPFAFVNPVMDRLMMQHLENAADMHGLILEMDRLFLSHLKVTHYKPEFSLAHNIILDS